MGILDDGQNLFPEAKEILLYMGRHGVERGDAGRLTQGAGLTDRGFSKGIKQLTTHKFLTMGADRIYQLSPKGASAIQKLMVAPSAAYAVSAAKIAYDLCAVVPDQISAGQSVKAQIGLSPLNNQLPGENCQIMLRLNATAAQVTPQETVLTVSPQNAIAVTEITLTPAPNQVSIRLRIEAYQIMEMDEIGIAGGMYVDVPVGNTGGNIRALHIPVNLVN